jgi:hypothetical protein
MAARTRASNLPTGMPEDHESLSPSLKRKRPVPSTDQKDESLSAVDVLRRKETYFNSTEAAALFAPKHAGDLAAGNTLKLVEERIAVLQRVNMHPDGWRDIIADKDKNDGMKAHDIFAVRQKAQFVCRALQIALEKMNSWSWRQCCQQSVVELNKLGVVKARSARVTMDWHNIFARGPNLFPNPRPMAASGRKAQPCFFEKNPMAGELFLKYADSNIDVMSIEFMTEYVNGTLLPILIAEHNKDLSDDQRLSREDFLKSNGFLRNNKTERMNISKWTVLRWMNNLGFQFDTVTKGYSKVAT